MSINPYLPQGPFQMLVTASKDEHQGSRHVYVIDASGRKIASIWGKQDEKLAVADLLVAARGTHIDPLSTEHIISGMQKSRGHLGNMALAMAIDRKFLPAVFVNIDGLLAEAIRTLGGDPDYRPQETAAAAEATIQ